MVNNIEAVIKQYGNLIVIRHVDNDYTDIIIPCWTHDMSQLIGTKKFKYLFPIGIETNQIKVFFVLNKHVPEGFNIKVDDLILVLDKNQYTKNKFVVIEKYIISYIGNGIIEGGFKYYQLYCDSYRFKD